MSRYGIPHSQYEIVVGYDNPLQTFFHQVYDPAQATEENDEGLISWSGYSPREVQTLEQLNAHLEPWGVQIDPNDELGTDLLKEQAESPGPNAFQRENMRIFGIDPEA